MDAHNPRAVTKYPIKFKISMKSSQDVGRTAVAVTLVAAFDVPAEAVPSLGAEMCNVTLASNPLIGTKAEIFACSQVYTPVS